MSKKESVKNFDGDIYKVPEIRNWVVRELVKFKVDDAAIIDIKVALTEALSNIFRHAYENELVKPVRIKICISDDRIEIVLRDFGKKFDLNAVPNPDLEKPAEGGYGIYLMRSLLDGIECVPMKVGTKTIMWKNRGT